MDLVHAIKDFPHSQLALDAARARGLPCVATAHGTYTIQPLHSPVHAARARRVYLGFNRIISVSNYTRRRLLELMEPLGMKSEQVEVVPNCVDVAHYLGAREVGTPPWHSWPFTLSIGEIKERKGHHLALEAWCRFAGQRSDLHHVVVGKLPGDDYEERLREIVARHSCQERVHFLGNVSEDEKVDLLQRAELFIHTPVTASDGGFEGFGIVYLEASAAGTPCLGTLDCGAEDAIVEGLTGRLVEQEVGAVEQGLQQILLDPEEIRRLGEQGRRHAEASGWEGNARSVLKIYKEALEG